jgi:UDP-N-acetylmuramoyl-L-alanyl-D-glutamate--2,6-diaminopimelate ligase
MALISLSELFHDMMPAGDAGSIAVTGLSADSRDIKPGFVFFAVPGTKADGLQYAQQAISSGAIAIVCTKAPPGAAPGVQWLEVKDVRLALSKAAARFHSRQPEVIVAVTGTSGKTSVAAFVRQIWLACGNAAAALGTTGVITPSGAVYGSLTTPDPVSLHRTLDQLAREGVTHLAMEASSHGLDQHRLDGVRLVAGAFTNLSRDHLDYHPDLEHYLAAKLRLFDSLLQPGQYAVIDADGEYAQRVIEACRARGLRILTTGRKGADIVLVEAIAESMRTIIHIKHEGSDYRLALPLAGDFMASNALVAAGLCIASGSPAAQVFDALQYLEGAPGRLERVGEHNGAPVFVDYAHKPDALEKVLKAIRPSTPGKLYVVFGCGGDRDAGKRPIMGEIAARNADVVIVTDDNPRSENPAKIRQAILAATPGAIEIGDRAQAIEEAVRSLCPGDSLIVAGKGHETGQIVGATVLPFSDHEAVRNALRKAAEES